MAETSDGSLALAATIWPLLLTSFVGTLPLVAISLFVAPIAADLQTTTAIVGGLRGLAGVAALGVGFALAPLIDRVPRVLILTIGLLLIAVASVLPIGGSLSGVIAFYVLLGATMALLMPTVQAASADRVTGPAAGQAASL